MPIPSHGFLPGHHQQGTSSSIDPCQCLVGKAEPGLVWSHSLSPWRNFRRWLLMFNSWTVPYFFSRFYSPRLFGFCRTCGASSVCVCVLWDMVLFLFGKYFVGETWWHELTSEGTNVLTAQNRLQDSASQLPLQKIKTLTKIVHWTVNFIYPCLVFHRFVGGTSGSKCQVWLQRVGRRTLFRPNGGRRRSAKAVRPTQSSTCWTSRYRHRPSHFTSPGTFPLC
jgi:hypothetical protein